MDLLLDDGWCVVWRLTSLAALKLASAQTIRLAAAAGLTVPFGVKALIEAYREPEVKHPPTVKEVSDFQLATLQWTGRAALPLPDNSSANLWGLPVSANAAARCWRHQTSALEPLLYTQSLYVAAQAHLLCCLSDMLHFNMLCLVHCCLQMIEAVKAQHSQQA